MSIDLAALRARNLPRCTSAAIEAAWGMKLTANGTATAEEIAIGLAELRAAIDKQFHCFIPPQKECLGCGDILASADPAEALMRATFVYGLAYGEGSCSRCGYPARANHRPPSGEDGLRCNRVLQYHPDELEELAPQRRGAAL